MKSFRSDVGEESGIPLDALPRHCGVSLVEFDADAVAAQAVTDEAGRAGTEEGIEDHARLGRRIAGAGGLPAGGLRPGGLFLSPSGLCQPRFRAVQSLFNARLA